MPCTGTVGPSAVEVAGKVHSNTPRGPSMTGEEAPAASRTTRAALACKSGQFA